MEGEATEPKRPKLDEDSPGILDLNPLLINLILERLFVYLKGSTKNSACLGEYRRVSKVWDKELVKIIRQDTQINLSRIISPYPDGFGWTESQEDGAKFYYKCPYSIDVPFENIEVTGTCDNLRSHVVTRWFEIMGCGVKSLHYNSPLSCYHQTRFLECVLKRWCPNLKTLYLDNIDCFITLIQTSRFTDPSEFICDLKQIILCVEGETIQPKFNFCEEDIASTFLKYSNTDITLLDKERGSSVDAMRAYGLRVLTWILRELWKGIDGEGLEYIRRTGTDGGILGQIFKMAPIEKFVVKKLSTEQCQDMVAFLNYRPHKLGHSLKHFEFDNVPLAMNHAHLAAFRMIKFPLTTIRFGIMFATHITRELRQFLLSFSNTLENLEFNGNVILQDWEREQEQEYIDINLPLLPKLKTFVNKNIFTCRLGGFCFLKNMPSLEMCSLTNAIYHSSIFPLSPPEVFNMLFQVADFNGVKQSLKELRLNGKISYVRHIESMEDWFPQLRKVDLILNGADVFVDFLRVAKKLDMEDVKVSFYANDNEWCNVSIQNTLPFMNKLKYLELVHLPDSPLTLTKKSCKQGFALAPQLTSLKLENFGFFFDELQVIHECLSHISCVKFSRTVLQHKPVDLEFSVGCIKPYPFPFAL